MNYKVAPVLTLAACLAAASPARADVVTEWNEIADGMTVLAPPFKNRIMAMVQVAVHDALNSIDPRYETYLGLPKANSGAFPGAAVAAAAYRVLLGVVPTQSAALGSSTTERSPAAAGRAAARQSRLRNRRKTAAWRESTYDRTRMGQALFDLSGRIAVVAGGTSGIGRTLALGLADAGADVVVIGRRENAVNETATAIESRGRRTLCLTADVTDRASLERVRSACVREFGHVDILVAAAGVTTRVSTLAMDDADWRRIIDTNLTGTLYACQVFGEVMVPRGSGRIINVASLSSFLGFFEVAAYTASKAGVAGLTRALAVEWAVAGVTVNAIVPGVFRTDLNRHLLDSGRGQELLMRTPMRRFGQLEELVGATVFLASDAASFVTGQLIAVDGGFLASGVNQ